MNILDNFINDRRHLIEKYQEWKNIEIINEIITIPTPQILAGFVGYLNYKLRNTNVYYRGEADYHKSTIPSLFRFDEKNNEIPTNEKIAQRYKAYEELIVCLIDVFKIKRFKNDNIEPILQHYGIKTSWIDLVDNLFISIWFSNHNSKETHTYIKIFCEQWNDKKLQILNLVTQHSSLSLRPHCQHGYSATKKDIHWDLENIDFTSNMIAIIKIPNNKRFWLKGEIFSNKYMFPEKGLDNTFKLLDTEKFNELVNRIAQKHNLSKNELLKR